ncbi:hypothetical protein BUALT_Bualt08G0030900 [Buddleja alternifolia]|uniref:Peroxin-12 n=1 Tax=Buddleja alternifolia TaxID=168488 RepID=A0AAV6X4H9_9LAMI|nr:hypothetical protein BUALT_Bualt08G0030900 [Buddleja alternifolia]
MFRFCAAVVGSPVAAPVAVMGPTLCVAINAAVTSRISFIKSEREATLQASLWGDSGETFNDSDYLGSGNYSVGSRENSTIEASARARWMKRLGKTICACYPLLHAGNEGFSFAYQLLYLLDATGFYSLGLHALGIHVCRATGQELMDTSSRISKIRSRERERLRGPPWLKRETYSIEGSRCLAIILPMTSSNYPPPFPYSGGLVHLVDVVAQFLSHVVKHVLEQISSSIEFTNQVITMEFSASQGIPWGMDPQKPELEAAASRKKPEEVAAGVGGRGGLRFARDERRDFAQLISQAVQGGLLTCGYAVLDYAQTGLIAAVFFFKESIRHLIFWLITYLYIPKAITYTIEWNWNFVAWTCNCWKWMMEWWYQSAEERMSAPTVYPPPPPPPPPKVAKEGIPLPPDKTLCSLCSQKRVNPSVLAVSGFVFCYTCIFKYVSQYKRCPVTLMPAAVDQIRRLFHDV